MKSDLEVMVEEDMRKLGYDPTFTKHIEAYWEELLEDD